MARPDLRSVRRPQIARAFIRVLGRVGHGGATIAALADEAAVAPGLIHHYFRDRAELFAVTLDQLMTDFAARAVAEDGDPLVSYVEAALGLGARADVVAARAWVGVFAEAIADPALATRLRAVISREVERVERMSKGRLDTQAASGVVAFIVGALIVGAFTPVRARGFAAPTLLRIVAALRR